MSAASFFSLRNSGDCCACRNMVPGFLGKKLHKPFCLSSLNNQYSFSSRTALTVRIIEDNSGFLCWRLLLF